MEKLKIYKFVIVEFLNEKSTDIVPSIWISVENVRFICFKKPLPDWESYICSPQKFFSKLILFLVKYICIYKHQEFLY